MMQKVEKRLQAILKKSTQCGLTLEMVQNLDVVKEMCKTKKGKRFNKIYCVGLLLAMCFIGTFVIHPNSECLLNTPIDNSKVFREAENCRMCIDVTKVDKIGNITPQLFDKLYSETRRPVVITDGTRGWSAVQTFNFDFFKNLYALSHNYDEKIECQFFPYKTEFRSLLEALNMSVERSRLEPGTLPWYIGWSNCNDEAGKILRKHYDRPYFLPKTSENIALSWIFMGGPGAGAHLHVDNVHYPSWQAQLRGRKKWRLAPPPECYYFCQEFEVTVEPGEIIVVDTNRWYHQTHILQGDISITIGSEFD